MYRGRAETLMWCTPRKRFNATCVISKQLNSVDFRADKTCRSALWAVFSTSRPKAPAWTSPPTEKQFHPAWRILSSSLKRSNLLISLQPFEHGSLSNSKDSGNSALPSIRMDPALILSANSCPLSFARYMLQKDYWAAQTLQQRVR